MGRMVAQIPNEDPERLKRVLDAKWRTIGVDKEALEQQAAERKAQEEAEAQRIEAAGQMSNYYADQVSLAQQAADAARAAHNRDVENFRTTEQLKSTRREYDLNRPDGRLIDRPARVGDDDERLGTSSMQRFDGEDLSAADRAKMQQEQNKSSWDDQSDTKAAIKAAHAEAEAAHAELIR
jgi:hypothetical protein